jgi:hypothetical protein
MIKYISSIKCKHCGKEEVRTGSKQKYCKNCRVTHHNLLWVLPYSVNSKRSKKEWKKRNPEKVKAGFKKHYELYKEEINKKAAVRNKGRYQKLKLQALTNYGGNPPKCACCGESEYGFLSLDHINGGGGKHRTELKKKHCNMWEFINRFNFPSGYQVLCFNCNMAIGFQKVCPHKKQNEL